MLTEAQKQLRKTGLGASDVSALFDLNEWKTKYRLWYEKTGRADNEPDEESAPMWWGTNLESTIVKRFEKETGKQVSTDDESLKTRWCPQTTHLMCHPDGIIESEKHLLEVKIARYNPDQWGASDSSQIPPKYQLQVQAQLACFPEYTGAYLAVFFYQTLTLQIYKIERNEEMITAITRSVIRFWNDYVMKDVPPDLYTVDDVKLAFPVDNKFFLEASPLEIDIYEKLNEGRNKLSKLKKENDKYENDLIVLCGANTGIKNNGDTLMTYKAAANGKRRFYFYGTKE
jgi:putative phage-type endonuclease